jgi:hypothetical protein
MPASACIEPPIRSWKRSARSMAISHIRQPAQEEGWLAAVTAAAMSSITCRAWYREWLGLTCVPYGVSIWVRYIRATLLGKADDPEFPLLRVPGLDPNNRPIVFARVA